MLTMRFEMIIEKQFGLLTSSPPWGEGGVRGIKRRAPSLNLSPGGREVKALKYSCRIAYPMFR